MHPFLPFVAHLGLVRTKEENEEEVVEKWEGYQKKRK
jgi:hypothetical protein